ncbi:MAG: calcium-binding protein, partial [Bifidobacteriaceae bacterium]|nr:calcium-binding protein [Bifidobacteriaceae bacterium]
NDRVEGGCGDDILVGGRGDDILVGGEGDDSYVFNIGDGNDTIYDGSGDDRIVFGQGVTADSVLFCREKDDLVIRYGSGDDQVTVHNAYWYSDGRCFVESIEFADGTKYEIDYENLCLKAAAVKRAGVAGAAETRPAAAGCAACFDAAGFIAGVEEYAVAKNLPWVSGSAGYRGKTAASSGLSDSGQDYSVLPDSAQADSVLSYSVWSESVLSESSGCGSAVYDSGSAVEAGINSFTDLIIQDMCELAAGSACASASAAAAPAAQSAPVQLWAC